MGARLYNNFLCVALFFGAFLPVKALAKANGAMNVEDCKEKLSLALNGSASHEDRIRLIEGFYSQCGGTGAYDLVLATSYLDSRNYIKAEVVARRGLGKADVDNESLVYVIFKSLVGEDRMADALVVAENLISESPNSRLGYLLKGEYLMVNRDYIDSAFYLEKSKGMHNGSEVNNQLVVVYYNLGRYADAVKCFEDSESLNSTAIHDVPTVLSAAASYSLAGNNHMAEDVLDRHLKVVPGSESNPVFVRVRDKIRASATKGGGGNKDDIVNNQ